MKFVVAMIMLASALVSAYNSDVKLRRDGMLNLYPFPRVGRVSRNTWQVPVAIYPDFEELSRRQERESHLYPFPRTGRALPAGPREFNPSAVRRTDSPGMWFGPRLGRSFKNDDDLSIQTSDVSEPEQTDSMHDDRRKREALN